jgi:hypothetical protein
MQLHIWTNKWEIKSDVNKAHSAHCLRKAHSPYKHHMCYRCPNSQPILTSRRRFSGLWTQAQQLPLPSPSAPAPLSLSTLCSMARHLCSACGRSMRTRWGEKQRGELESLDDSTAVVCLLCFCSPPARPFFFRPHVLSSRTCTRLRCLPARCARKPVRQLRPGPLFDASAQLGRRLTRRRSDKARLAFNWPHRP